MLKKFFLIFYFITLLVFPFFVFAQTAVTSETTKDAKAEYKGIKFTPSINIPDSIFTGEIIVTGDTLGNYIVAVYRYGGIFAGIVAMFMLVYAGWEWLLAGGNSSKISQAKNKISGTLIGLALLFGGYLLLSLISKNLISFKSLEANLPDPKQLCPAITESELCVKNNCLWTPATTDQIAQDPSIKGSCQYKLGLATFCVDESVLRDITNIPGIRMGWNVKDKRLTGPTVAKLTTAGAKASEKGYQLYVTGAFRSYEYQQELYNCYMNCVEGCESCNKASRPNCETSNHMLGIAVDVCLISGGTDTCAYIDEDYNCHTGASSAWCNSNPNQKAAQLELKRIMTESGFSGISDEWWHYNNLSN